MLFRVTCVFVALCATHVLGGGIPGRAPGFPGGLPGGDVPPGGTSGPVPIVPFHIELAQFAVNQMGNQYFFHRVLTVREQVVAGMMYHMELLVSKALNQRRIQQVCSVRVQHQPWMVGQEKTLVDFTCRNAGGQTKY